ncbi:Charged multivesicular body protein 2b [Rhizophlyctis rosea]|nr:Charged multivesicular body protein 2b [Rhizophlyctis rosea]
MRQQQRALRGEVRTLQRDKADLERQEKQITAEIKKAAKANNMAQAKLLAKQLIRIRKQQEKNMTVQSQINGIGYRTQAIQSQAAMAKAMGGATKAMVGANKQMDLQKLQVQMQEFAEQNAQMDMKEEMMNDAIDNVMDEDEDEEEGENIMNQVLDEIGIGVGQQLADAPRTALPSGKGKETTKAEEDELQARLDELLKGAS